MTKAKTRVDLALTLDPDWPPEAVSLTELVVEARAADWDFTTWCYVSGHDASDPDARQTFECLLAYARGEGPRRLELTAAPDLESICAVAAPNKCLAQSNKSCTRVTATKRRHPAGAVPKPSLALS
jgi:hypothetical protein